MSHLRPILLSALLAGIIFSATPAGADQRLLYRYTDDEGQVVLKDQLPPDVIPRGYDVLRRDGTLVRSVPGTLSEEDRRRLRDGEEAERLREEEKERLQAWDESLLRRYSTVEEIREAKERALSDIRLRIAMLNSNLALLKRRVERNQERAAEQEKLSGAASEELLKTIQTLRWQIGDTEEMIAMREKELQEVEAAFERDIHRFETLLERYGPRQ